MCVAGHVNNSEVEFPLCVNDIIVSVNKIEMAKMDGGLFANTINFLRMNPRKLIICGIPIIEYSTLLHSA